MPSCRTDCLEKPLSRLFHRLGRTIGDHPFPFLIIPVLMSAALGTGFVRLDKLQDIEYLFTPTNGRAKMEREAVASHFPINYSDNFLPTRFQYLRGYANVIITARGGGDVLTPRILNESIALDQYVKNFTIRTGDGDKSFSHLCAKWKGSCLENQLFLEIVNDIENNRNYNITYPLSPKFRVLAQTFSGSGHLTSAIQLSYYLKFPDGAEERNQTLSWLEEFLDKMANYTSPASITVSYSSTESTEKELEKAVAEIIPFFSIAYTTLITFAVSTSMTSDVVISKPWLAFMGAVCAGMAIVSAIGLISAAGVNFINIVGVMPFLIIGVGIDDAFILLSTWRSTNRQDPVETRMANTFEEAAMSITLTSVTNVIAFGVGAITFFPSIQIFCLFTGVAAGFAYFYIITFFGACLALTGRREHGNRHCYTFRKIPPRSEAAGRSAIFRMFCAGGYDKELKQREHGGTRVFRKYLAPWILSTWGRVVLSAVYLGYLAGMIYGCLNVKEGLDLKNLANDGSYVVDFYDDEERYFKTGLAVQFVIKEELDYSNETVQKQVEDLTRRFENTSYTRAAMTESWLRDYVKWLNPTGAGHPNRSEFVRNLTSWLKLPGRPSMYSIDVEISDTRSAIVASRYTVRTRPLNSSNEQKEMMTAMRRIADESELDVVVFHPAFVFFDQYLVVLSNTLQNIGIALVSVILIALLLVPEPLCAAWVMFSIASIDAGVIGFMSLWGVSVDAVSMINIILCIGFSVDFSAHVAYNFVKSSSPTKKSRAVDSLTHLGFPLVQNTISSVLGITVLAFSGTYLFRTFFKTMFLVIIFGAYHGMIVLPVMLSFFGPGRCGATQVHENLGGKAKPDRKSMADQFPVNLDMVFASPYSISNPRGYPNQPIYEPPPDYD